MHGLFTLAAMAEQAERGADAVGSRDRSPRFTDAGHPLTIFVAAILVRTLVLGYMFHIKAPEQMWTLNEEGAIARSLLLDHSFSAPFHDASGPTAWVGPGYPALVALVFRVFGICTAASAKAVVALNALFSALTALVVLRVGRRVFGPTVGLLAAWVWALSPYAVLLSWLIWETALSALLMTYGFWRILVAINSRRLLDCVYAGICWGIAALVNPALAVPLPFLWAYLLWTLRGARKQVLGMALAFVVVLSPWTIRNEVVFHHFFLVRSNAWAEVYFGNVGFGLHPRGTSGEYQRIGEGAYVDEMKDRLLEYVRHGPEKFLADAMRRVIPFWTAPGYFFWVTLPLALLSIGGLILGFRYHGTNVLSFALVLGLYPAPYYLSHTYARFRYPIEPLMFVMAAYCIVSGAQWFRRSFAGCLNA